VIALPFLDSFIQGLNERFSPENRCMQSIVALVPSIIVNSDKMKDNALIEELMFWKTDLPDAVNLKV